MKSARFALIALFALPLLASEDGSTHAQPKPDAERFRILSQRNIFSKDRGRRRESRPERSSERDTSPPPKPPDPEIVLRGIVHADDTLKAFLEDRSAGGAIKILKTGDSIGKGKIGAITLESIEYIHDGATKTISVGMTLSGAAPSSSYTASSSVSSNPVSGGATASAPADAGSPELNAILERMRKKRMEEMSK